LVIIIAVFRSSLLVMAHITYLPLGSRIMLSLITFVLSSRQMATPAWFLVPFEVMICILHSFSRVDVFITWHSCSRTTLEDGLNWSIKLLIEWIDLIAFLMSVRPLQFWLIMLNEVKFLPWSGGPGFGSTP